MSSLAVSLQLRINKLSTNRGGSLGTLRLFIPFHCIHSFMYLFILWAYGVVVTMFDFHRSDRDSNPGRGVKIS